ncbi:TetR/AcrR family transcriptional regulator [Streptomyces cinnamoneus]|uniref:TetR family transcriptional regulator n=1 Tax=Streptomyces cinnamoneus TaxID=53446 RepID=A0A918TXD5_STRCJ|nr:TetR/AcrR family transcriptional regulator [Streptomyces cinnamoneus]GHC60909.1 TetR family transcriptional regulator [Streptomyces cinnamoneus]
MAPTRGRPRSFDRDAALEQAVLAFWARGYEATSIADLTRAMGIGAPSLYAAFGDKAALFREALDRYQERYGGWAVRAVEEEPTARAAVERLLREAAAQLTAEGRPRGCLLIGAGDQGTTTSGDAEEALRMRRRAATGVLEERIRRGARAGELPAEEAPALARLVLAVFQGMAQQARDGASRTELEKVAAAALRGWP